MGAQIDCVTQRYAGWYKGILDTLFARVYTYCPTRYGFPGPCVMLLIADKSMQPVEHCR